MSSHTRAGQPAQDNDLINVPRVVSAYYHSVPTSNEKVSFGTSGHRGTSLNRTFTHTHVAAICQALVEYRQQNTITGPLFIGMDTHALSECAFATAVCVLVANGVSVYVDEKRGYTPTPVISHAILAHNRRKQSARADGIVITPSHNPPQDGGFKYNPPNGGPADSDITDQIQYRANQIIRDNNVDVKSISFESAWKSERLKKHNFIQLYVDDIANVIDVDAIAKAGVRIGVDPLGGSGIAYWEAIADTYGLNIEITNTKVDPTFSFMTLDSDEKIRMDCSSKNAMAGLIKLKDTFDIAVGNDPDFDRHGIVTPNGGLMNPNHYLAVAINYLYTHRPYWPSKLKIGKTLVSSSMIDRVACSLGREIYEVPVGFKWFVDGLFRGELGFCGEESAGASFLRKDGRVWTTDKDGIILALLGAEIIAVTGKDPHSHYQMLTEKFSSPIYSRMDIPASAEQKKIFKNLSKNSIKETHLVNDRILQILTHATGNNHAIGGLKIVSDNGWFAARPSGTEDIYKIYAESFIDENHLKHIIADAQRIIAGLQH